MRLTIRSKLGLGFGLLLCLLLGTGLLVEWGLRQTTAHLDHLIITAEPLSAAAYELEINIIGTGLGVMKYLEMGAAQYRARIAKDQLDFARFLAQYNGLASTPQARELGASVGRLYDEFHALGERLVQGRDQKETLLVTLTTHVAAIDDRLDAYLDGKVMPDNQQESALRQATTRMESHLAELGTWLGQYLQRAETRYKTKAFDEMEDVQAVLQHFATLPLTEAEQSMAGELTRHVDQVQALLPEVLTLHEAHQSDIQQFPTLRTDLDAVLDDELQEFTAKGLQHAKLQVQLAEQRLRLTFLSMLGVGLVLGVGISLAPSGEGLAVPCRGWSKAPGP